MHAFNPCESSEHTRMKSHEIFHYLLTSIANPHEINHTTFPRVIFDGIQKLLNNLRQSNRKLTSDSIYTNIAKRNLFTCLSGMAGHSLYGMAPCFGHTGVTTCLSGMAGHALYGMAPCFGHTGVTFDAENDRPGPGSLRGHLMPVTKRPEALRRS